MTRVDPLHPKQWPPQMRDALTAMNPPVRRHPPLPTEGRPKGINVLGALAYHPELAKAFFTFNGHLLSATSLTPRQRELLILRTAVLRQSEYEWAQHGVIGDATWATLNAHLSTPQILDAIFTVGAYETLGWMLRSFGVALDDDVRAHLSGS